MATAADAGYDRKVSGGRVFERVFATIKHNPGPTIGLAFLIGAVPGFFINRVVTGVQSEAIGTGVVSPMTSVTIILLSVAISMIISALTQAALTRATVAESEGRRASLAECLKAGLAVVLPLIALSILLAIGVGIGLMLLLVPGVILYCMWSVAVPALVEEHRGVFGSFGRSRDLTRGARWKVFGILLVVLVVYWLLSAVLGMFMFSSIDLTNPQAALNLPTGLIIASLVIGTLVNLFWGLVQASLYVELRDWKDGPATENLAQIFA